MRAARKVAGLSQKEIAVVAGVKNTVISNAEAGETLATRPAMSYYYRAHRIDFNFLMNGDFAQLPGDVQEALFPALEAATSEWDQKERSDRSRAAPKREPDTA